MPARAFTVNCSIMFTDIPLLDRPAAARTAGFDSVEFWWPFIGTAPADHEIDAFVRAVTDAGVTLSGLNFAGGDLSAGERGLLSDPATATMFRDSVDIAVAIGAATGTSGFNALYGNRRDDLDPSTQDDVATANLTYAATAAARIGASVLLEPISGVAAYPLRLVTDAVEVLERVAHPSVLVLADLYHLAVNGEDIAAAIDGHADRIGHVQIADAPGRGEPGTGTVDLAAHVDRLVDRGYTGLVSAEYVQTRENTFDWLFGANSRFRDPAEGNEGGQGHSAHG